MSKRSNSLPKNQEKVKNQQEIDDEKKKLETHTEKLVYELMLSEEQNKGEIEWRVYKSYI
jgi:hypothetical protein